MAKRQVRKGKTKVGKKSRKKAKTSPAKAKKNRKSLKKTKKPATRKVSPAKAKKNKKSLKKTKKPAAGKVSLPKGCPDCGELLKKLSLRGVKADLCPTHGLWLDSQQLRALCSRSKKGKKAADAPQSKPPRPPARTEKQLGCPVCNRTMQKRRHDKSTLDYCRQHGIWMGRGEVARHILSAGTMTDQRLRLSHERISRAQATRALEVLRGLKA